MQRDRYLVTLECANCGTKGAAEYEDTEALPRDRDFVSVRGAFVTGSGDDPEIYCAHCNTKVA
jgi:hypothetical protein